MNILRLAASPLIKGPLPKHGPLLEHALQNEGVNVTTITWGTHRDEDGICKKICDRISDIFNIFKNLKKNKYDLMFVHTAHDWKTLIRDTTLLFFTRKLCPYVVVLFHGSASDILSEKGKYVFKYVTSYLLNRCDAILLLSNEEMKQWQKYYPNKKFFCVNNPFVPSLPSPINKSFPWSIPEDDDVILFVGRIIPEKGIFDLIDALYLLRKSGGNVHLIAAGDGPFLAQVRSKINNLGLTSAVTLTGYVSGEDLFLIYQRASMLVLPTYWPEGFPTVISEAMSYGLPIITTSSRGSADHLVEGVNALFVPPKNPQILCEVIQRLLTDKELRTRMAEANREKIREFSPEKVGRHYKEILQIVLNSGNNEIFRE